MVSTLGSESKNPSSNLGRTFICFVSFNGHSVIGNFTDIHMSVNMLMCLKSLLSSNNYFFHQEAIASSKEIGRDLEHCKALMRRFSDFEKVCKCYAS